MVILPIKPSLLEKFIGLLPVGVLLVLAALRFVGLSGGLVLGEPDEFIHQAVAENFKESPWPVYNGAPWFFQLPLYPFLGHLLDGLFPQKYVSLRVVSVLASIFLILATYYFLSRLISKRLGFIAALLIICSPFSIYISRLALLDSTVVSLGIVSLYFQEMALKENRFVWSLFGGIALSLALMVKYTALIYLLVFVIFLLVTMLKDNRNYIKEGAVRLRLIAVTPLIIVFISVLPLMILMRSHDSYPFKLQLFTSLGFIHDFWRIKGGELGILYYWQNLSWWLTWPVLLLFIGGLFKTFRGVRKFPLLSLGFLLTVLIAGTFRPFYPRYFYPFIPFITIIAAASLDRLFERFGRLYGTALIFLVFAWIAPTSIEAFRSTRHHLIEDTAQAILNYQQKNPWIFTNYWPNFFGTAVGSLKSTWLSDSRWDATAYVPDISESPLEILNKEGGFVLLEKYYSKTKIFINPPQRVSAGILVSQRYSPTLVIVDSSPNFPHLSLGQNQVELYLVPPHDNL